MRQVKVKSEASPIEKDVHSRRKFCGPFLLSNFSSFSLRIRNYAPHLLQEETFPTHETTYPIDRYLLSTLHKKYETEATS